MSFDNERLRSESPIDEMFQPWLCRSNRAPHVSSGARECSSVAIAVKEAGQGSNEDDIWRWGGYRTLFVWEQLLHLELGKFHYSETLEPWLTTAGVLVDKKTLILYYMIRLRPMHDDEWSNHPLKFVIAFNCISIQYGVLHTLQRLPDATKQERLAHNGVFIHPTKKGLVWPQGKRVHMNGSAH